MWTVITCRYRNFSIHLESRLWPHDELFQYLLYYSHLNFDFSSFIFKNIQNSFEEVLLTLQNDSDVHRVSAFP